MAEKKEKKKRRKRKKNKVLGLIRFFFEVLLLMILALGLFAGYKYTRIERGSLNETDLAENSSISQEEKDTMSGFMNIALFGVDSREGRLDMGANSDTIMVCSINRSTKEIKVASVYRDTYLDRGDGDYGKCTECYAAAGPSGAVRMLNKNLDLAVTDYVTVDFKALVEIVDYFGGVDITLSEGELEWLNSYLVEEREVLGRECDDIQGPGLQHLNGMQALAYCRIRYIGLDYERTQRQREVLAQILKKAQSRDFMAWNDAIDLILPMVQSSLTMKEFLELLTGIGVYQMEESTGFPFDKTTMVVDGSDCVIPADLEGNVSQLHEYLYGTKDYVPSDTVRAISQTITSVTGVS